MATPYSLKIMPMRNDFHTRFEIDVDIEEARKRFVNRIQNRIFHNVYIEIVSRAGSCKILETVADELGLEYRSQKDFKFYTGGDFFKVLQAVEGFYKAVVRAYGKTLEVEIVRTLNEAELDLGIRWENGRFIRSGAKLLDEQLVNESLHWLTDQNHQSVLQPYSKGLEHFLQATKRPELLSDAITDTYEALEALAKIITGRDKDLSANAESFLKEVKASEAYKKILKEYIAYANNFRHGVSDQSKKPNLSAAEVESFIYLTGIFIRLAIQGTGTAI